MCNGCKAWCVCVSKCSQSVSEIEWDCIRWWLAYLDLRHVGLLLAIANLCDLCMGEHADDRAVLLQLVQLLLDGLLAIRVLLCVSVEGLLLGLKPAS